MRQSFVRTFLFFVALGLCIAVPADTLSAAEDAGAQLAIAELLPAKTSLVLEIRDVQRLADPETGGFFAQAVSHEQIREFVAPFTRDLQGIFRFMTGTTSNVLSDEQKQRLSTSTITVAMFERVAGSGELFVFDFPEEQKDVHELFEEVFLQQVDQDAITIPRGAILRSRELFVAREYEVLEVGKIQIYVDKKSSWSRFVNGNRVFLCDKQTATQLANLLTGVATAAKKRPPKSLLNNRRYQIIEKKRLDNIRADPLISLYVDPKLLFRSSPGLFDLGIYSDLRLGWDEIAAIGIDLYPRNGSFDPLLHAYIHTTMPRRGAMAALAFENNTLETPHFIPHTVDYYVDSKVKLDDTLEAIDHVLSKMGQPDRMAQFLNFFTENTYQLQYQKFFDRLTGRIGFARWHDPNDATAKQFSAMFIQFKDREILDAMFEKDFGRLPKSRAKMHFQNGYRYWKELDSYREAKRQKIQNHIDQHGNGAKYVDVSPSMGVIDDYVIYSTRAEFMQEIMNTTEDPESSLRDNEQFQNVRRLLGRLAGNSNGLVAYSRPGEVFRNLHKKMGVAYYRNAVNAQARDLLHQKSKNILLLPTIALSRWVTANKEPIAFDTIQNVLLPAGAAIKSEDSGLHIYAFQTSTQKLARTGNRGSWNPIAQDPEQK